MRVLHPLLICLAIVAPLAAAPFNPRVTDRAIALNESVRITFATMRPQREHVDIERAIRTALSVPAVHRHWRLLGEPDIVQHEKAKDISVRLHLRPRTTGELPLPRIPVTWLDGDLAAEFGTVTVADHIVVGTEEQDLPNELAAIGGYAWGSDAEAILAHNAGNRIVEEDPTVIQTPAGLRLHLVDDRLARGTLLAQGLTFAAAERSFVQRWGTPSGAGDDGLTWHIGWVTIRAVPVADGVEVHLVHERIEASVERGRVTSEVFDVLTQPAAVTDDDAATDDAPAPPDATDAPPADDEPSMDELEAELRRRLGQ